MNNGRDNSVDHGDDQVSRVYRDFARERAPSALDAAVLDAARRHASGRWSGRKRWLQPVALAAAVCLSLVIVLDFSRNPEGPAERRGVPATPPANTDRHSPRDGGQAAGAAAANGIAETAIRPANTQQKFSAPAVANQCDGNARMTPDTWLACIDTLKSRGRDDDAERERRDFRTAFPDYSLPVD